jgi:hypothetical protein
MLNALCKLEDATDDIDSSGPCVGCDTRFPAALVNDTYRWEAALNAESNLPLAVASEPE